MAPELFETLLNKFKLQYNETIESLQLRKLYQFDDENVEEWLGRLHIYAVECNYQEVDRQLKEQFIHGLNDKYMLEEIIKELMATKNDDHITSGGVLAWAQRVETQRAQAAVLNTLTESRQFDKIKVSKKTKDDQARAPVNWTTKQQPMQILWGNTPAKVVPSLQQDVWSAARLDTPGRSATAKGAAWSMKWSKRCLRSTD